MIQDPQRVQMQPGAAEGLSAGSEVPPKRFCVSGWGTGAENWSEDSKTHDWTAPDRTRV